ncbi:hypothetical protein Tco_1297873 [Tanacetum coccineum]
MFSLVRIMPPRMRTRSTGWPVAESRGGGTGGQGFGANRGVEGVNGNVEGVNEGVRGAPDFSMIIAQQLQNLLPAMLAQVGNQRNVGNQNGNVVNENVQENVENVIVNGNQVGCSYKEFLACNPKEYDGKGGAVVLTRWIKKMEYVQDMSGCCIDQKVKYTAGSFVGKALTWWNSQIRMLSQEVAVKTELWNYAMAGASHAALQIRGMVAATEPKTIQKAVKDKNGREDNKRTRTGNAFATTANPIERENMGHLAKDYRGVPRNVNPVNARNPTVRSCYECGSTDHGRGNQGNQARGRAFMLGAEEARQDPYIVTGIEPSELGFRYEIEIASGQLVEIDKVIKGCKLEIEGHVFDIDLIPFRHEMRIPLPDSKVLRVLGERLEEKARLLMSAKASDKKQEDIVMVRDFPDVFLDDLSGLPPL